MNNLMAKIYETVLPEMAEHGIEDTTSNRIAVLSGLWDAWNEDDTHSVEKSMYMTALAFEILHLQLKKIHSTK